MGRDYTTGFEKGRVSFSGKICFFHDLGLGLYKLRLELCLLTLVNRCSCAYLKKTSLLFYYCIYVIRICHFCYRVEVTFQLANGDKIKAKGKEGDSLLDIVVNNNVELDGFGACEGTLTCSTCHLILKKEDFERLPDKPTDEELDMLDLAYDLTETSRLGCQIIMTKELNGLEVKVPATVNDVRNT